MKHYAYAVLFIDTTLTPATVRGAGVFSEPSPTTDDSRTRFALLFKTEADTWPEAKRIAEEVLAGPAYSYAGKVVRSQSRGVSRVAEVIS